MRFAKYCVMKRSKTVLTCNMYIVWWRKETKSLDGTPLQKCESGHVGELATDLSKTNADWPRNVFQTFYCCYKYNSTSSIEWYHQISSSSNHVREKRKTPVFYIWIQLHMRISVCHSCRKFRRSFILFTSILVYNLFNN